MSRQDARSWMFLVKSCQNGYPVRIIVALLIARVPHIQAFEPWPVMQPCSMDTEASRKRSCLSHETPESDASLPRWKRMVSRNADPRTLDHDVECDDRTLHASDSPLESDVDEDSTNRGDRVTGRDVRSCSSGNRREEGNDSSTGHASQKGEDGTKEQAEKPDPRPLQELQQRRLRVSC